MSNHREHFQNCMTAPVPQYMTKPFANVMDIAEVGQIIRREYVQNRTARHESDCGYPGASGHGRRHWGSCAERTTEAQKTTQEEAV